MAKYFGNAFSLQMVKFPCTINVQEVRKQDIFKDGGECEDESSIYAVYDHDELPSDVVSVVGHPDTARVLGVPFNRASIKLNKGDILYVAQLIGGRLPEGATTLPDGFKFKFLKVEIA